jgi:hypothetical protein
MRFPDSFQQRNYYCGDYDCPTRHKIDTNSDRQTAAAQRLMPRLTDFAQSRSGASIGAALTFTSDLSRACV